MQIIHFNFRFYFLQHDEVFALRYSLCLYRSSLFCLLQEVNGILINDHLSNLDYREEERDREKGGRDDDTTSLTMHKRRFPRGEKDHSGVVPASYWAPQKLLGKFPTSTIPCRCETPPNCYRIRNLFRDNKWNATQNREDVKT